GNRRTGKDHGILLFELDMVMVACSHALQRRVRLALGARTDHDHFLVFHIRHASNWHKGTFWHLYHTEFDSDFEGAHHTAPIHGNFTAVMRSGVNQHLDTVDITGEDGYEHPPRCLVKDIDKTLFN